jgi:LysR family hydrogen peroxide-inducible transcriptional activator
MRYAVAVAETGNFRLAARSSHVSASGLSMQLQKLESLLGLVLFDRSKKPVLPTPEGIAALRQIRAVLRETERLGQVVADEDGRAGRYRLGVIPTLSPTVLPLFLGRFARRFPRVDLVVQELKTEEIIAHLRNDTLDAGLAATPLGVPGFYEHALATEAFSAYLPPDDPLAKKATLSQHDLRGRELFVMPEGHCFRSQVLSYCGSQKPARAPRIQFESGSFQTLVRLVDDGLGATVLPELVAAALPAARRRAQLRPFVAPRPVREIGLVTARSDLRRRVTDALVQTIGDALAEVLPPTRRAARVIAPMASR